MTGEQILPQTQRAKLSQCVVLDDWVLTRENKTLGNNVEIGIGPVLREVIITFVHSYNNIGII